MTDNLDQIKSRIAALAAKTVENGCTEAEAISAMEAVGKLLQKYNLSMNEIELKSQQFIEDYVKLNSKNINKNISMLLGYIAEFTDCKCWNAPGYHLDGADPYGAQSGYYVKYTFFGMESDAKLASYLLYVTTQAMLNDAHKFVKSLGIGQGGARSPMNNFQYGFANRIGQRLREIKAANKVEIKASGSTALMVLKDQLVTEEFVNLNLRLRKAQPRKISRDDFSRIAGQDAANNVNLSNPIETGKGRNKLAAN